MAGDWIKMRADLGTHPKVVRMASALNADRLRVIGGLHAVWCLFDMHSEDGKLFGYTLSAIDDLIGWPYFAQAMQGVEWLEVGDDYLCAPRFDAHNGQSAKRRAQEADRKREVRKASAAEADKKRTREEKRREEVIPPKSPKGEPKGFGEFYEAYPRKQGRAPAAKAFAKVDVPIARLIAAIELQKRSEQWTKDGGQFIPLPATWLNQKRWEDQIDATAFAHGRDPDSRVCVEEDGVALGLGKWDDAREQWPAYKARVRAAQGVTA